MSESVFIQVPARIHLGFLDMPGATGNRFGSIGLPVEGITTELTISRAATTSVSGDESPRIIDYLEKLRLHLGISAHHRVDVHHLIPAHSGLGSGTQLALAVAAGLRTLHKIPLDAAGDAVFLGRGKRSGIGIAAFEQGGFILDAGRDVDDRAPTVISRIPFPENWRIILVFDRKFKGIHGSAEIAAFRSLPSFPAESSGHICRMTLMGVMPALIERDIAAFGKAVTAIQEEVGRYFSPAQGGHFTSKTVGDVVTDLARQGAVGIGQSSWGPTGFAFAESQAEAQRMVDAVDHRGLSINIVAAQNRGAQIMRALPMLRTN